MIDTSRAQLLTRLRGFGFLMAGTVGGFFGIIRPMLHHSGLPIWPWLIAVPFLILAFVAPQALHPVFQLWIKIGSALGLVNSRVVLGLVYFLILVPVGVIQRLLGRNSISSFPDHRKTSYRVSSTGEDMVSRMDRPF